MVDSVLMLTTVGSSCLEICENSFDSFCGDGMVSGVASELFLSWPFTPLEMTVPMRMPTVNVTKIVSVYAGRLALSRAQKPLASGSIELPPLGTKTNQNKCSVNYTFSL